MLCRSLLGMHSAGESLNRCRQSRCARPKAADDGRSSQGVAGEVLRGCCPALGVWSGEVGVGG